MFNISGIAWYSPARKWIVDVRINGKFKCIGLFDELADAIKARDEAKENR